jgi:transposase
LTRKGTIAARKLARAHILRLADEGKLDAEIVSALGVGLSTVERTRRKYVEGGLDKALGERPRPGVPRKLSEKGEAYLIALSCSTPPDDQVKWSMQLLTDRLVEVGIVDEISDETVRRTLKKCAEWQTSLEKSEKCPLYHLKMSVSQGKIAIQPKKSAQTVAKAALEHSYSRLGVRLAHGRHPGSVCRTG